MCVLLSSLEQEAEKVIKQHSCFLLKLLRSIQNCLQKEEKRKTQKQICKNKLRKKATKKKQKANNAKGDRRISINLNIAGILVCLQGLRKNKKI